MELKDFKINQWYKHSSGDYLCTTSYDEKQGIIKYDYLYGSNKKLVVLDTSGSANCTDWKEVDVVEVQQYIPAKHPSIKENFNIWN